MPPLLGLEHIAKRFGQVIIADDVSISVGAGDSIGIIGPNGAGKTTLFSIISGDVRPDSGVVVFDGQAVNRVGPAGRCRLGMGRTYQIPRPFLGLTVFENVLVAAQQGDRSKGSASYAQAYAQLRRTGLEELANRPAATLGLLQRKRLELARALASRPRLLLLDEVAAGLTDLEVLEVKQMVEDAHSDGIAIVWIEHVVRALVGTVERLLCLAGGSIIGDGDPGEVLASTVVREVYLGTDASALEPAP